MKAVVLAAGRGTRLRPLTDRIPKPLVDVAGRPLIERVLSGLAQAGVRQALVVVGYRGEQIIQDLGDGRRLGLSLEYARQDPPRGTGHAVLLAEEFVREEPWMMSFGDVLTEPSVPTHLLELARRHPDCHCLTVKAVPDPCAGGVVALTGERVTDIVEKPASEDAPSDLVNAGLFAFQPDLFSLVRELPLSPRGEIELTGALQRLAVEDRLRALTIPGFWSDVGTLESLEIARAWAEGREDQP